MESLESDKIKRAMKLRSTWICHALDQIDERAKWRMGETESIIRPCCTFASIRMFGIDIDSVYLFHDMSVNLYGDELINSSLYDDGIYLKFIQETPIEKMFTKCNIKNINVNLWEDFGKLVGKISSLGDAVFSVNGLRESVKNVLDMIEESFRKLVLASNIDGKKVVDIYLDHDSGEYFIRLENNKAYSFKNALFYGVTKP